MIKTKPTIPTKTDVISIANAAKNKILPTFLEFLITNGITITKQDKRLETTPADIKILVSGESSNPK